MTEDHGHRALRVVFLADAASPHIETQVLGLSRQGVEVRTFSLRPTGPTFPGTVVAAPRWLPKLPSLLWLAFHARREIRGGAALVHAHYVSSYGVAGSVATVGSRVPLVLSVWGTDIAVTPNRSILHRRLALWSLRRAELVLATSQDLANRTEHLMGSGRIRVQPFGIDTATFTYGESQAHHSTAQIICVRSLRANYGIDVLLSALSKLGSNAEVKALVVGDGPERASLEAIAANDGTPVKFVGFVPNGEIPHLLRSSDIAVLPTTGYEAFGVSALEAMGCGLPVVASRIGGLEEVVQDGVTGLLVTPGDPNELATALIRLIKNPAQRASMGRAGAQLVRSQYDFTSVASATRRYYEEILWSETGERRELKSGILSNRTDREFQ